MKPGDKVFYKGREFSLIEVLTPQLSRINSNTEERLVESKHLKTKEQYEKELKDKPFGRHDVWIN